MNFYIIRGFTERNNQSNLLILCQFVFKNIQYLGVLLIWIIVGHGPTALAEGAGGSCLDIFLSSIFSPSFSLSLETARHKLKYCLKGP